MATVDNSLRSTGPAHGGRSALAAALAGAVIFVLIRTAGASVGVSAAAGLAAAGAAVLGLWPRPGASGQGEGTGGAAERPDPPYALVLESLSDPVLLASDQGEEN